MGKLERSANCLRHSCQCLSRFRGVFRQVWQLRHLLMCAHLVSCLVVPAAAWTDLEKWNKSFHNAQLHVIYVFFSFLFAAWKLSKANLLISWCELFSPASISPSQIPYANVNWQTITMYTEMTQTATLTANWIKRLLDPASQLLPRIPTIFRVLKN